jgi:hypothetical protein
MRGAKTAGEVALQNAATSAGHDCSDYAVAAFDKVQQLRAVGRSRICQNECVFFQVRHLVQVALEPERLKMMLNFQIDARRESQGEHDAPCRPIHPGKKLLDKCRELRVVLVTETQKLDISNENDPPVSVACVFENGIVCVFLCVLYIVYYYYIKISL